MIDESVLERALRVEAASYVPPADGPDAILALAGDGGAPAARRPRRWRTGLLSAAAAVVVGGLAVSFAGQAGEFGPTFSGAQTALDESTNAPYGLTTGGGAGEKSTTAGDGTAQPQTDAKIVRTGNVSLEVPRERVAATLGELSRIAAAHRGFVASSSAATTRDTPQGSVTLRVPVADFDAVVAEVGRLGTVISSDTRGEDVTSQVTDVEARLRSLTAARSQLQTLLARARTVGEVLSVQERITEVQTQIEQLQGRQKSLADRTTFGTVTVSVTRTGGHDDVASSGFARAWRTARDGFVGGFEGLVAASGTIAFLLLVGGVLLLLGRAAYRLLVRRIV